MWTQIVAGLLGADGSYRSAAKQNKAINERSDQWHFENAAARDRAGMMMFGPEDWADFKLAMQPDTVTQERGSNSITGLLGGKKSFTINQKDKVDAAKARFFGKYPSMQTEMMNLQAGYGKQLDAEQAQIGRNTGQLDRMASEAEMATGDGREAQMAMAKYNNDQGLQAANQRAMATLGMMGPSSLLGNQMSANQRLATADLTRQQIGIDQQARQNWQISRANRMGMLGGRMAMGESAANHANMTKYNMAKQLPEMRNAMMSGGAFSAYMPLERGGASPIGAAMMSGSKSLGSMGSPGGFQTGGATGMGGGGASPFSERNG